MNFGPDLLTFLHSKKELVRVVSLRRRSNMKVRLKHKISPKRDYKLQNILGKKNSN